MAAAVREKFAGYVTAALGFVAGLAWNEAIKELIDILYPFDSGGTLTAKFTYATILTLITALVGIYVARLVRERHKK